MHLSSLRRRLRGEVDWSGKHPRSGARRTDQDGTSSIREEEAEERQRSRAAAAVLSSTQHSVVVQRCQLVALRTLRAALLLLSGGKRGGLVLRVGVLLHRLTGLFRAVCECECGDESHRWRE